MSATARRTSDALEGRSVQWPADDGGAVDSGGRSERPRTFMDDLFAAERARCARLRRLWQMSAAQRIAGMRRGELTREELAAWSARHPEQVPLLNGEWEWIAAKMSEACE
jgi:hypothetical protein